MSAGGGGSLFDPAGLDGRGEAIGPGPGVLAGRLSDQERLDRLRLIRSENVGPVTWRRLLARFGTAGRALEAVPDLARRGGRSRPIRLCSVAQARRELAAVAALGAQMVTLGEPAYPPLLAAIEDAPPVLVVRGALTLLDRPMVALVGARNASLNGRRLAHRLAADLGAAGLVVVSGLARGLDAAAHAGALATGTLAVMAGGVDVIYPPDNEALYREIADAGVLVSELPPGEQPQARHFPRRNRIISGLSLGVVVVEAAARSGSLITARFAADQGREVMAVPGSPLDARARGPNGLIKSGAALVEEAGDVLAVLEPRLTRPMAEPPAAGFAPEAPAPAPEDRVAAARPLVLQSLNTAPLPVDELVRQCQLSPAVVAVVLLELELAGRLDHHPGNRVSLLLGGEGRSDP